MSATAGEYVCAARPAETIAQIAQQFCQDGDITVPTAAREAAIA